MAFDLSSFVSNLNGTAAAGLARANVFRVVINAVDGITETRSHGEGAAGLGYDLLVKGAQVPGSTIAPMPVNYGGRVIKLTGNRTFDNWTVTILNDEEFAHRKWLQDWMYTLAGTPDGDRSKINNTKLYNNVFDATISLYNNIGYTTNVWKMYNMWPTALGDITLDWSADAIQEYTCEFAFEYWTHGNAAATSSTDNTVGPANVIPAGVPT